MNTKYTVIILFFSVLVGCGGGGSTTTAISAVDEIIDQVDTTNVYPETFASLKQELPWGLQDKTGATTALRMALYGVLASQFQARSPNIPSLVEPNDDICTFGGNVTSTFSLNTAVDDLTTYSSSRNANYCRTSEADYFDGSFEAEGSFDQRNEDLRKDTHKFTVSKFSRNPSFIPSSYPLKSQLNAVQVFNTGSFNDYVETSGQGYQEDKTDHYIEDIPNWVFTVDGLPNLFKVAYHKSDRVDKKLYVDDSTSSPTIITVNEANYSASWVMTNNAKGNALIREAGFFAGTTTGTGYKTTFPEGDYNLSVQVLSPIVMDSRANTAFPSEGSILVDLSSHNISAIVTFSGGAQISITTNGVNVVTNFDKLGQVIQ